MTREPEYDVRLAAGAVRDISGIPERARAVLFDLLFHTLARRPREGAVPLHVTAPCVYGRSFGGYRALFRVLDAHVLVLAVEFDDALRATASAPRPPASFGTPEDYEEWTCRFGNDWPLGPPLAADRRRQSASRMV